MGISELVSRNSRLEAIDMKRQRKQNKNRSEILVEEASEISRKVISVTDREYYTDISIDIGDINIFFCPFRPIKGYRFPKNKQAWSYIEVKFEDEMVLNGKHNDATEWSVVKHYVPGEWEETLDRLRNNFVYLYETDDGDYAPSKHIPLRPSVRKKFTCYEINEKKLVKD